MSQFVQEEGAKSRRSAEPGTQRDPCHARLTYAPSAGPKRKKRRSHAVTFPFLPEKKPSPREETEGDELLEETEAESQTGRRGRLPSAGGPPLGLEALRRTAHFAHVQLEFASWGPLRPIHTPQTRVPRLAVLPPSVRPKALGFCLLGANFLPLGKAGSAVWGFAAEEVGLPGAVEKEH